MSWICFHPLLNYRISSLFGSGFYLVVLKTICWNLSYPPRLIPFLHSLSGPRRDYLCHPYVLVPHVVAVVFFFITYSRVFILGKKKGVPRFLFSLQVLPLVFSAPLSNYNTSQFGGKLPSEDSFTFHRWWCLMLFLLHTSLFCILIVWAAFVGF